MTGDPRASSLTKAADLCRAMAAWTLLMLGVRLVASASAAAVGEEAAWLWESDSAPETELRIAGRASQVGSTTSLVVHGAGSGRQGMTVRWRAPRDPATWRRGERWRVPVPDTAAAAAAVLRVGEVRADASGSVEVLGDWEGEPGTSVRLWFRDGAAAGTWTRSDGTRWVLAPERGGRHRLRKVDAEGVVRCGNADGGAGDFLPAVGGVDAVGRSLHGANAVTGGIQELDLLMCPTPASTEGAGGETGIRVLCELAVAEANEVFERSAVRARLRLVGVVGVDYTESGDLGGDLSRLTRTNDGWLDEVPRLRDAHAADVVCLVTEWESSQQYAGMANQLRALDRNGLERAYMACLRPYLLGNYTLVHELGHVLGANHDRETSPEGGLFRHAFGARFEADGVQYRTVMAYRPGVQIPHFSNPDVTYRGVPTGVRGASDNAGTVNTVAPELARIREPSARVGFGGATVRIGEWEREVVLRLETRGVVKAGNVRVRTVEGSARAGVDFEARDERIPLGADGGEVEFRVVLRDTGTFEGERRFTVTTGEASAGVALGPFPSVTVSIQDDEDEAGRWLDTSFRARPGADYGVRAVALVEGGGVVVGGGFVSYGGADRPRVARLGSDGSVVEGFRAKVKYTVHAVLPLGDGRMAVAGDFNTVNDQAVNHLAVLGPEGALVPGFEFERGTDLPVRAMARAPGDTVVLGGLFGSVQGEAAQGVARITTDGALDRTFDTRSAADGPVETLAVDGQGRVVIGGRFGRVSGRVRGGVARLDASGRLDLGFATGSGADGPVGSVALDRHGRVLVAGDFTKFDGRVVGRIVRLTEAGVVDGEFRGTGGTGADGAILTVLPRGDGTIWVGGRFRHWDGVPRRRLARLLEHGEVDPGFDPGSGANDEVLALAEPEGGGLVVGGMFTEMMGLPRGGVAVVLAATGPPARFGWAGVDEGSFGWSGVGWPRQTYAVEAANGWGGWRQVGEASAGDGRLRGWIPLEGRPAGYFRLRRVLE